MKIGDGCSGKLARHELYAGVRSKPGAPNHCEAFAEDRFAGCRQALHQILSQQFSVFLDRAPVRSSPTVSNNKDRSWSRRHSNTVDVWAWTTEAASRCRKAAARHMRMEDCYPRSQLII